MASESFPFDMLKAETLRAMVRDLGANNTTVRTRDKMISFLAAVQAEGHEAALEALKSELESSPPSVKPKKRAASPGPTTAAKRGRTRAAAAEDAPPSAAARGRAREPSAKAREVNGGAMKKGGSARARPRARKGVPKGKGKDVVASDDDDDDDDDESKTPKAPKSKRAKARPQSKPEVVLSPHKQSSPRKEEEEEEEESAAGPCAVVDEDAMGEPDVGNISAITGVAAEAVVEEMLARGGDVDGGSAPMQVAVDVVTTVQTEPIAGPA